MFYVGLDVHSKHTTMCVINASHERQSTRTIHGSIVNVLDALATVPKPFAVAFEASTGYGMLYDRLTPIAERVVVAHPGHLRIIFATKRKNDRVDAEKLALLLSIDSIPEAHVPPKEGRAWRRAIERRRRTVADRTRVKLRLRALLRSHGIAAPRSLWSKRQRAWLAAVEFDDDLDALGRDVLLDQLDRFDESIARLERALDERGRRHPGVTLMQTIPGIGPRTAEALMAWIDRPERFSSVKKVAAYVGLVPRQDQSGAINRLGHITKDGPGVVRQLLVEAAWQGVRRNPDIKAVYERFRREDRERKKIAIVATAHYLLRVAFTMLRTGEVWNPGLRDTA